MTLAIALANAEFVMHLSDRRLTVDGVLIDDSSNKVGHAVCDDGAFLFSFTGLARSGTGFVTARWLNEKLHQASRLNSSFSEIVYNFARIATEYFANAQTIRLLSPADRRLTIMMTGYLYSGHIVSVLISNYQDFYNFEDHSESLPKFEVHFSTSESHLENPTLIQAIGQIGSLTENDEATLRKMLEERLPRSAIRDKAISLIQEIADHPRSGKTVGKNVNGGALSRDAPWMPFIISASATAQSDLHGLNSINLRSGAPYIELFDVKISSADGSPITIPVVGRNQLCPCGSGLKYKKCHRR